MEMVCKESPVHSKFKLRFLELSGIFFSNVSDMQLVEGADAEP